MLTKREIMQKFATTEVGVNGLLNPTQADRFINEFVQQAELINMVQVKPVTEQAGYVYYVDMSKPATVAAAEATEYSDETGGPEFSRASFQTVKRRTQFELTWEDVHDTIEGAQFGSTIVGLWNQRWGLDTEYLALLGDEGAFNPTPADEWEKLFNINDGWLTLLTAENGVNILDAAGLTYQYPTFAMFAAALRLLPTKYRKFAKQPNLWMTSTGVVDDYRNWLAGRSGTLGDAIVQGLAQLTPQGIAFASSNGVPGLAVFPETLGESEDLRTIVLGSPKNFIWIVRRNFELMSRFIQEKDSTRFTGYSEDDFRVVNYPAFVRIINVEQNPTFGEEEE
jgi:hypothetical protein